MPKPVRRLGFYSRNLTNDGRSSEQKLKRHVVDGLMAEMGGPDKVSFRQGMVIHMLGDLALRHQLAQKRYVRDPDDDRETDKHVCTLVGTILKSLKSLDFDPVKDVGPTLQEYLSARPAVLADDAP